MSIKAEGSTEFIFNIKETGAESARGNIEALDQAVQKLSNTLSIFKKNNNVKIDIQFGKNVNSLLSDNAKGLLSDAKSLGTKLASNINEGVTNVLGKQGEGKKKSQGINAINEYIKKTNERISKEKESLEKIDPLIEKRKKIAEALNTLNTAMSDETVSGFANKTGVKTGRKASAKYLAQLESLTKDERERLAKTEEYADIRKAQEKAIKYLNNTAEFSDWSRKFQKEALAKSSSDKQPSLLIDKKGRDEIVEELEDITSKKEYKTAQRAYKEQEDVIKGLQKNVNNSYDALNELQNVQTDFDVNPILENLEQSLVPEINQSSINRRIKSNAKIYRDYLTKTVRQLEGYAKGLSGAKETAELDKTLNNMANYEDLNSVYSLLSQVYNDDNAMSLFGEKMADPTKGIPARTANQVRTMVDSIGTALTKFQNAKDHFSITDLFPDYGKGDKIYDSFANGFEERQNTYFANLEKQTEKTRKALANAQYKSVNDLELTKGIDDIVQAENAFVMPEIEIKITFNPSIEQIRGQFESIKEMLPMIDGTTVKINFTSNIDAFVSKLSEIYALRGNTLPTAKGQNIAETIKTEGKLPEAVIDAKVDQNQIQEQVSSAKLTAVVETKADTTLLKEEVQDSVNTQYKEQRKKLVSQKDDIQKQISAIENEKSGLVDNLLESTKQVDSFLFDRFEYDKHKNIKTDPIASASYKESLKQTVSKLEKGYLETKSNADSLPELTDNLNELIIKDIEDQVASAFNNIFQVTGSTKTLSGGSELTSIHPNKLRKIVQSFQHLDILDDNQTGSLLSDDQKYSMIKLKEMLDSSKNGSSLSRYFGDDYNLLHSALQLLLKNSNYSPVDDKSVRSYLSEEFGLVNDQYAYSKQGSGSNLSFTETRNEYADLLSKIEQAKIAQEEIYGKSKSDEVQTYEKAQKDIATLDKYWKNVSLLDDKKSDIFDLESQKSNLDKQIAELDQFESDRQKAIADAKAIRKKQMIEQAIAENQVVEKDPRSLEESVIPDGKINIPVNAVVESIEPPAETPTVTIKVVPDIQIPEDANFRVNIEGDVKFNTQPVYDGEPAKIPSEAIISKVSKQTVSDSLTETKYTLKPDDLSKDFDINNATKEQLLAQRKIYTDWIDEYNKTKVEPSVLDETGLDIPQDARQAEVDSILNLVLDNVKKSINYNVDEKQAELINGKLKSFNDFANLDDSELDTVISSFKDRLKEDDPSILDMNKAGHLAVNELKNAFKNSKEYFSKYNNSATDFISKYFKLSGFDELLIDDELYDGIDYKTALDKNIANKANQIKAKRDQYNNVNDNLATINQRIAELEQPNQSTINEEQLATLVSESEAKKVPVELEPKITTTPVYEGEPVQVDAIAKIESIESKAVQTKASPQIKLENDGGLSNGFNINTATRDELLSQQTKLNNWLSNYKNIEDKVADYSDFVSSFDTKVKQAEIDSIFNNIIDTARENIDAWYLEPDDFDSDGNVINPSIYSSTYDKLKSFNNIVDLNDEEFRFLNDMFGNLEENIAPYLEWFNPSEMKAFDHVRNLKNESPKLFNKYPQKLLDFFDNFIETINLDGEINKLVDENKVSSDSSNWVGKREQFINADYRDYINSEIYESIANQKDQAFNQFINNMDELNSMSPYHSAVSKNLELVQNRLSEIDTNTIAEQSSKDLMEVPVKGIVQITEAPKYEGDPVNINAIANIESVNKQQNPVDIPVTAENVAISKNQPAIPVDGEIKVDENISTTTIPVTPDLETTKSISSETPIVTEYEPLKSDVPLTTSAIISDIKPFDGSPIDVNARAKIVDIVDSTNPIPIPATIKSIANKDLTVDVNANINSQKVQNDISKQVENQAIIDNKDVIVSTDETTTIKGRVTATEVNYEGKTITIDAFINPVGLKEIEPVTVPANLELSKTSAIESIKRFGSGFASIPTSLEIKADKNQISKVVSDTNIESTVTPKLDSKTMDVTARVSKVESSEDGVSTVPVKGRVVDIESNDDLAGKVRLTSNIEDIKSQLQNLTGVVRLSANVEEIVSSLQSGLSKVKIDTLKARNVTFSTDENGSYVVEKVVKKNKKSKAKNAGDLTAQSELDLTTATNLLADKKLAKDVLPYAVLSNKKHQFDIEDATRRYLADKDIGYGNVVGALKSLSDLKAYQLDNDPEYTKFLRKKNVEKTISESEQRKIDNTRYLEEVNPYKMWDMDPIERSIETKFANYYRLLLYSKDHPNFFDQENLNTMLKDQLLDSMNTTLTGGIGVTPHDRNYIIPDNDFLEMIDKINQITRLSYDLKIDKKMGGARYGFDPFGSFNDVVNELSSVWKQYYSKQMNKLATLGGKQLNAKTGQPNDYLNFVKGSDPEEAVKLIKEAYPELGELVDVQKEANGAYSFISKASTRKAKNGRTTYGVSTQKGVLYPTNRYGIDGYEAFMYPESKVDAVTSFSDDKELDVSVQNNYDQIIEKYDELNAQYLRTIDRIYNKELKGIDTSNDIRQRDYLADKIRQYKNIINADIDSAYQGALKANNNEKSNYRYRLDRKAEKAEDFLSGRSDSDYAISGTNIQEKVDAFSQFIKEISDDASIPKTVDLQKKLKQAIELRNNYINSIEENFVKNPEEFTKKAIDEMGNSVRNIQKQIKRDKNAFLNGGRKLKDFTEEELINYNNSSAEKQEQMLLDMFQSQYTGIANAEVVSNKNNVIKVKYQQNGYDKTIELSALPYQTTQDAPNDGNPDNLPPVNKIALVGKNQTLSKTESEFSKWTKSIGTKFSSITRYLTGMMLASKVFSEIGQGLSFVKTLDASLSNIGMTMNATQSQLKNLGEQAIQTGVNLKTDATNVLEATTVYANANETSESILKKATPTIMLSNASGDTASTSADQIQAVENQFDGMEGQSQRIVNSYEKISAGIAMDFASGISTIADGVKNAGAVANESGLEFETFASIIGKVAEVTRAEGGSIGNLLKTTMARISRSSSADEEVSAEDRSKASLAYKEVLGIDLYDSNGQYKDLSTTLSELAGKWDTLTDAEKNYISEQSAGTRGINIFKTMMENYDDIMALADSAKTDTEFYKGVQERWENSLKGKQQGFEAQKQQTWNNLVNAGSIGGIYDLGSLVTQIVNGVIVTLSKGSEVATSLLPIGKEGKSLATTALTTLLTGSLGFSTFGFLKGLPSALRGDDDQTVGKLFAKEFAPIAGLVNPITGLASNVKTFASSLAYVNKNRGSGASFSELWQDTESSKRKRKILEDANTLRALSDKKDLSEDELKIKDEIEARRSNYSIVDRNLEKNGSYINLASMTMLGLSIAGLIGTAIQSAIDSDTKRREDDKTKAQETKAEYDSSSQKTGELNKFVTDNMQEYQRLSKGVDTSNNRNVSLTSKEYDRYLNLNDQFAQYLPDLITSYDENGKAILNYGDNILGINKSLEEQIAKTNEIGVKNINDALSGFKAENDTSLFDTSEARFGSIDQRLDLLTRVLGKNFESFVEDKGLYKASQSDSFIEAPEYFQYLKSMGIDFNNINNEEQWNSVKDQIRTKINELEQTGENYGKSIASSLPSYLKQLREDGTASSGAVNDRSWNNIEKLLQRTSEGQIKSLIDGANGDERIKSYVQSIYDKAVTDKSFVKSINNLVSLDETTSYEKQHEILTKDLNNVVNSIEGIDREEFIKGMGLESFIRTDEILSDLYKKVSTIPESKQKSVQEKEIPINQRTTYLNDFERKQNESSYIDFAKLLSDVISKPNFETGIQAKEDPAMPEISNNISEMARKWIDPKQITSIAKESVKANKINQKQRDEFDQFIKDNNINTARQAEQLSALLNKMDSWNKDELQRRWDLEELNSGATDAELASLISNLETVDADIKTQWEAKKSSQSSTGLSVEEIQSVQDMFKGLDGYNYDKLFESTAQGVHLNVAEMDKLEGAYRKMQSKKYSDEVQKLTKAYGELNEEISSTSDGSYEQANLIAKRDELSADIQKAREIQSMFEGITNPVTMFVKALSEGEEGDTYDTISSSGAKTIQELYESGLVGTQKFRKFAQMLTDEDLSKGGIDAYVSAYEKGIDGFKSYFTEDSKTGIMNGIHKLMEDGLVTSEIKDGHEYFSIDDVDMHDIAKSLGISDALTSSFMKKLGDFGVNVPFTEEKDNLKGLRKEAEESAKALSETGKKLGLDTSKESLKDINDELDKIQKAKKDIEKNPYKESDKDLEKLEKIESYYKALKGTKLTATVDATTTEGFEVAQKYLNNFNEKFSANVEINWEEENQEYFDKKLIDIKDQIKKLTGEEGIIKVGMDGYEEAKNLIQQLIHQKELLEYPSILTVDTSNISNLEAREDFQEIQSFAGNIQNLKELREASKYREVTQDEWTSTRQALNNSWRTVKETPWVSNRLAKAYNFNPDFDVNGKQSIDEVLDMLGEVPDSMDVDFVAELVNADEVKAQIDELTHQENTVRLEKGNYSAGTVQQVMNSGGYSVPKDFDYTSLDTKALQGMTDKEVELVVRWKNDPSEIENYTPEEQQVIARYKLDSNEVDKYTPEDKNGKVNYSIGYAQQYNPPTVKGFANYFAQAINDPSSLFRDLTRTVTYNVRTVGEKIAGAVSGIFGGNKLNGTANLEGTADNESLFKRITNKGKAFLHGSWGAKESSTSLVGELGSELRVRGNQWELLGENGAEMADIRKGDVVFNHKQTKQLLENGYVTADGGRGKMIGQNAKLNGTAFVDGSYSGGFRFYGGASNSNAGNAQQAQANNNNNNGNNNNNNKKDAEKFFDWIEVKLDRIQREIDDIDKQANSIFKSFSSRQNNFMREFEEITEQIKVEEQAVARYKKEADSVGLSSDYVTKVKNGLIDIEKITDETLSENIEKYQQWYEKALDCQYAITDLKEKLAEIMQTKFDLVSTQFDLLISKIQHSTDMIEGQLTIIGNKGNFAGRAFYEALVSDQEKIIKELEKEFNELNQKRYDALNTGSIIEGSESDLQMIEQINNVEKSWQDAHNAMLQYKNDFLEMDSSAFEWINGIIDLIPAESEFLRNLMSVGENQMFVKDKGMLNEYGKASGSLHALDYDVYMSKAEEYRKKASEIDQALAKDPYNTILIDKKNEYIEAQREAIELANDEKKAVHDLIEESYNRMLDALQKIIDKRKEMLQAEKDLYDYERNVSDQTKQISSFRKQLLSLQGDDSEESKARKQQISEQLKDAEKNLEETEYDRWIQDQETLMDKMYTEYERIFNERLDDLDGLLREMMDYANNNSTIVKDTITQSANDVGYTISQAMTDIWNSTDGVNGILSLYNETFQNEMATANKYVKGIYQILKQTTKTTVDVDYIPKPKNTGKKPSSSSSGSSSSKKKPTSTNNSSSAKKEVKIGGMFSANGAPIYWDSNGTVGPNGSHQYFASDPKYYAEAERNGYVLGRWYKSPAGAGAGWFKKSDITGLKTGGYTGNQEGIAMLHKKERVLSAKQTSSFEKLVNDFLPVMTESFTNNSRLGEMSKSLGKTMNVTSDIDLTFNLPNVHNSDEFINELKNNKQFESIVQHMAFNPLSGKSSLRKNLVKTR